MRSSLSFCAARASICMAAALAKISTGAPVSIWRCNRLEPAKLKVIFVPYCVSNATPISVKTSFKLAAAATRSSVRSSEGLDEQATSVRLRQINKRMAGR